MALVGAVIIHRPDFFGAAARADEGDLRSGHTRETTGKLADDLVGELMRELANLEVSGSAAINFSDNRLRRGIAEIVKPGFDGDFGGGFRNIAETQVIGVCGRLEPGGGLKLRGDTGGLRRIKARAGDLDNAGELEIVANDLRKKSSVGFGRVGARREIGDGHARFGLAEPGGNSDAVLSNRRLCHDQDGCGENQPLQTGSRIQHMHPQAFTKRKFVPSAKLLR